MRLSRTVLAIALTVLVAMAPSACFASGRSIGDSTVAPSSGALFGIYLQTGTRTIDEQKRQVLAHESTNGRRYDLLHYYYGWNESFPTWRETWWQDGGRIPLLSWAGPTTTNITNGSQDSVIDARARGLKALGKPVLLRWFWEMDGSANLSRAVSPTAYKAAWRRIVSRFRAQGATNVEFVWCPTAWGFVSGEAPRWYPGDDVVDWTCADGYNWAPGKPGAEWRSLYTLLKPYYDWAVARPRPLMVGEFGAMEDPSWPGRKAQWLADARAAVKSAFPKIKAVVYFNGDGEEDRSYVWNVSSSSSARDTWRAWGLDSYYRTRF